MNTYHLKQKWDYSRVMGYPTTEEIDFLFAEVERLEKALAAHEKELREVKQSHPGYRKHPEGCNCTFCY